MEKVRDMILKYRETIYYKELLLENYKPKIYQIFEKVGLNHEKFKISGKKVRDMILKTPGNDLLQKITLRKLYFTFKICQKKKDICPKFIKFWENLVKITIMSKYPKKS